MFDLDWIELVFKIEILISILKHNPIKKIGFFAVFSLLHFQLCGLVFVVYVGLNWFMNTPCLVDWFMLD